MSKTIYRVGPNRSVMAKRGTVVYQSGDIVPEVTFDGQPGRIQDLLKSGHLTTQDVVVQQRDGALEKSVPVGPWRINPRDLAGKNLEQMHIMILEIDSSMKGALPETIEEAREFLSIDYHPDPATN